MREIVMSPGKPTRRHFTDAARAAGDEARRRKREMRAAAIDDHRDIFVIRRPDLQTRFCWEIRRFGGVVVERGDGGYRCIEQARSAGKRALSSLRGDA